MAELQLTIDINDKDVTSMFRKLNRGFDNVERKGTAATNRVSKGFGRLKSSVSSAARGLAIFGTAALAGAGFLGKEIFKVTAEFEKFESVLTNTFGSTEAAGAALKGLSKFAAETPFSLNKITESYVKLANRGIAPTMNELTNLGDVAAASGKGFDQLSEAILDISNVERWREFGIESSRAGNKVSLTYKGVTKTFKSSSANAKKAIAEFGQMKGVAGIMAAVSSTLGGRLNNLQDTFQQLGISIGKKLSPILGPLITKFGEFATEMTPKIVSAISWLVDLFSNQLPAAMSTFQQSPLFEFLRTVVVETINLLVDLFSNQLPDAMGGLQESPLFEFLKTTVVGIFNQVRQNIASVISVIQNLKEGFMNLWETSPAIRKFVGTIIKIFSKLQAAFKVIVTFITGTINGLITFFTKNKIGIAISEFLIKPIQFALDWISEKLDLIVKAFSKLNDFFGFTEEKLKVGGVKVKKDTKETEEDLPNKETEEIKFDDLQSILNGTIPDAKPDGPAPTDKDKADKITGGGPKVITINIENGVGPTTITQAQDPAELLELLKTGVAQSVIDVATFVS